MFVFTNKSCSHTYKYIKFLWKHDYIIGFIYWTLKHMSWVTGPYTSSRCQGISVQNTVMTLCTSSRGGTCCEGSEWCPWLPCFEHHTYNNVSVDKPNPSSSTGYSIQFNYCYIIRNESNNDVSSGEYVTSILVVCYNLLFAYVCTYVCLMYKFKFEN